MAHFITPRLEIHTGTFPYGKQVRALKCGSPANNRLSNAQDQIVRALQNLSIVVNWFREDNLVLGEAMERFQETAKKQVTSLAQITNRGPGRL